MKLLTSLAFASAIFSALVSAAPTCTEGQFLCTNSGVSAGYSVCAAGSLVQMSCGSGTVCIQNGSSLYCGFPVNPVSTTSSPPTTTTTTTTTTTSPKTTTSSKTTKSPTTTTPVKTTTTTTTTPVKTTTTTTTTTTTATATGSVPVPTIGTPRIIGYNDNTSGNSSPAAYFVPGSAPSNVYDVFILGFWLSSGAYDSAYTWTQLDAATRQSYLDSYHAAGKVVLVAAFGAAEFPTLSGVNPVTAAQNLAAFVKQYQLDGADIDWEDNNSLQAGTGEAWLVSFQTELRNNLPSPRYIITHAPQAPYFVGNDLPGQYPNGGYLTVDQKVGSLIDWYNVQFYNQGSTNYQDCTSLLNKSQAPFIGTSVFEIIAKGIPSSKVVIGKPITQADVVNTGFMAASTLASCISQAKATGKWDAGFFGWQITHDTSGWSNTVAAGL